MSARRGRQLLLLAVAMAAGGYVRTTVSPLQETMRIALALNDNQMALLQGLALGVPMAIAAVPLGIAIDRYSRVRLLLMLTVLNVLGTVLSALAPTFSVLFAARCLVGTAGYSTVPIVMSLLADWYAPAQRGRVTMIVSIGQLAGVSAAFALGGALLTMSHTGAAGSHTGSAGWRWAMCWLAAPLVPIVLLMLAAREPRRIGIEIRKKALREVGPEIWRYRAVITPLFLGILMLEIAVGAVLTWAAPTLSRGFNLSPDRIGAIMATALMVSGVLGPIVGGVLADLSQRIGGPRRTMISLSGLALLSVPGGFFAVMPGVGWASTLLVAVVTIILAAAVMGMTLFTIVIPNELRGLCVALLVGANILVALGLAPLMVSLLSSAIGGLAMIGRALTLACVTTCLFAAAIFAIGRRYFPRTAVQ